MMTIQSAKFVCSNSDFRECPTPNQPEYAFIGRSNVGKSSLINALTNNASLAKTSSKPGKTQLINHFVINGEWYLVDLPGYGYARVSKDQRKTFEEMISFYLLYRRNLLCTFVLVDIRHEPQQVDLDFLTWLGENEIPFAIVFTKSDKLLPKQVQTAVQRYKDRLSEGWEELPPCFVTSAVERQGLDPLLHYIDQINQDFDADIV